MQITLSQQYNVGEKPSTVILYIYINRHAGIPEKHSVVSHIPRIGCQSEKILYTVANPPRGLLSRKTITKGKVWQHTPPPPTRCSLVIGENK